MATRATAAALPSKKRKASHDSAVAATAAAATTVTSIVPRKESEAGSSHASDATCSVSFQSMLLDGTTSIGGASLSIKTSASTATANVPPKKRKASIDFMSSASVSDGPLRKRKLSDARLRLSSVGSLDDVAFGLGPLDVSVGGAATSQGSIGVDTVLMASRACDDGETVITQHIPSSCDGALAHLEALEDDTSVSKFKSAPSIRDEELSLTSLSHNRMAHGDKQMLIEALMGNSYRRDRLESWGGMSDISQAMGSIGYPQSIGEGTAAAAAIAASALQRPFLEDESDDSTVSEAYKPVPSKISLGLGRDRFDSIASLGEPSVSGTYEIGPELQRYVAEAMANVGDQLAELAGAVETVAGGSIASEYWRDIRDDHSDCISTASSLPEIQAELRRQRLEDSVAGRARSMSTSSNAISVDYDAVAAAVDAGEAATGALGLASFGGTGRPKADDATSSNLLPAIQPSSSMNERDMEAMRARARAAAGYIPPENLKPGELPPPSTKKRPKPATPHHKTIYNKVKHHVYLPEQTYSMCNAANKASSLKWDEMYECLLEFVEDQKVDTRGMTEKERKEVEWDGNVPTTFRTKDGKALGRWINNQRSAKHKGVLKKDRESKLMSTGLKWSVLSTNSWQDMMDELQLYIDEKTKDGSEWDGNVPTNYKIKGSCLDENGEERNLGRWINRQRSLYQSGKLRKDREAELETVGLKWSVLSTTSWQSMFDTLEEYVNDRRSIDGEWDGNVPANYKTTDSPPKALGRWINRQRTTYQKNKLKSEYYDMLTALGLKWSVHERRAVVPMSLLATPVKSNLTIALAPPTASNISKGPTPVTVNGSSAPKDQSALPDEVKSSESRSDASKLCSAANATLRAAQPKVNKGSSEKATVSEDFGASLETSVQSTASDIAPTNATPKPIDGSKQAECDSVVKATNRPPVKVDDEVTTSDRFTSDKIVKKNARADGENLSNAILPMKSVGRVHVGK